jgi:hypothetical protein
MVRDRVAPGARVRVPGRGSLVLSLASGTRLDLRAASVARVVELGAVQRFDLEEGALLANVARIAPGGRFVIATHDAEIEVKGTRFEVTVGGDSSPCEPRARTRVAVHEGVVAVRHGGREVLLGVNAVWPDCRVSPPAPSPIAEPRPAADRAPKRVTAGSRRRAAHAIAGPRAEAQAPVTASAQTAAPAPVLVSQPASSSAASVSASTLAEQNDLFAAALAAGRRGDVAEALRWLDHLIRRHPQGQLAERAHAERRRLIVSGKRE